MHDKHQITEEPCEVNTSSTVLKTSGVGDCSAEFNPMIGLVAGRKPKQHKIKLLRTSTFPETINSGTVQRTKYPLGRLLGSVLKL
jgi:chaperonin GroEL (HSP60 family)